MRHQRDFHTGSVSVNMRCIRCCYCCCTTWRRVRFLALCRSILLIHRTIAMNFHSWHILDRGWISDSRKFGVWCGSFKIYCVEPKSTDRRTKCKFMYRTYTHIDTPRKKTFISNWIVRDRYQFEKWLQTSNNLSSLSLWNLINKNKPKCLCNVK